MAEDHGSPEAGQLPRAWTKGCRKTQRQKDQRQKIAKERATQRVRTWTVQNEMRSVLGRVSASAARRIFDSANSTEIGA